MGGKPRLKEFSHHVFPLTQAKPSLQVRNEIIRGFLHFISYRRLLNHALRFHEYLSILHNSYLPCCIICLFLSPWNSFSKILRRSWNVACGNARITNSNKLALSQRFVINGGAIKSNASFLILSISFNILVFTVSYSYDSKFASWKAHSQVWHNFWHLKPLQKWWKMLLLSH